MPGIDDLIDRAIAAASDVGRQRRDAAMQMHNDQMANAQAQIKNQADQISAQRENAAAQNALRNRELDMKNSQFQETLKANAAQRSDAKAQASMNAMAQMASILNGGFMRGGANGSFYGGNTTARSGSFASGGLGTPEAQERTFWNKAYADEVSRLHKIYDGLEPGKRLSDDDINKQALVNSQKALNAYRATFPTSSSLSSDASQFGVSPSRVPGSAIDPNTELRNRVNARLEQVFNTHANNVMGNSAPPLTTGQKVSLGVATGGLVSSPAPRPSLVPGMGNPTPIPAASSIVSSPSPIPAANAGSPPATTPLAANPNPAGYFSRQPVAGGDALTRRPPNIIQ